MATSFSELYEKPRQSYYATAGTLTTTSTFDVNAVIGRNGCDGYIVCDSGSSFNVGISSDGSSYGNNILLRGGEKLSLKALDIDTIKLTYSTDCDYRIFVI